MKAKSPADPMLFLFGAPRFEHKGKPIELDTRKAYALAAYLVIDRQSHSRDALAALLYPEYDQAHARAALRRTLSTLQAALGEGQLEADREMIGIHPQAGLIVDVDEFHKRRADCQMHGHPPDDVCARCITPLAEAVALYHDDFMAGFTLRDSPAFDEWQFFQTETLRRELAQVLDKLVRHHGSQREYDLAILYARRWLALDPLHELAHRELMRLYAFSGQRAAALRQYQECVRVLHEELGVSPLEETTRLFESVSSGQWTAGSRPSPSTVHRPPSPVHLPLVGRDDEWQKLIGAYTAIRADGHLIVLDGEMGIGKTRLAEAFVEHAQTQGAVTLTARAYERSASLAYGPFIEALRSALARPELAQRVQRASPHFAAEAARLVPELSSREHLGSLSALDSPGAQVRFFEGLFQVLLAICAGNPPGILFIDDLQWMDAASLDLLTYIVRRLRGRPLCILGTVRGETPPMVLRALFSEAQRSSLATVISLSRLDAQAVLELVQERVPREIADRVYRETEGVPFFVVEYLAALEKGSVDWSLPERARDVLRSRLLGLTETGLQLLGAAAVMGRSFDFEILREASGRTEEETVSAVEELIGHGLVKELGEGAYDFVHEKLRALAYEETIEARRRLLHRRIAEVLVAHAQRRREIGTTASQVAMHFRQAGRMEEAAEYYRLAGEHARGLYANVEAFAHFQTALALYHPDAAALHEAIGDLLTLNGDYAAALASYQASAQALAAISPMLEHKIGALYHRRGEWDQATDHFRIALRMLDGEGASERARIHADWSLTAHLRGQSVEAQENAQRALDLAQAANDLCALAQARNILGILARGSGNLAQACEHLEQSVELGEKLQDPALRAAALNNLALVYRDRGDVKRARQLTETALALATSQSDRHREAALHNNLADLFYAAGSPEEAMAHLKQAVTIFGEIGLEAGTLQPEIWKLVEW